MHSKKYSNVSDWQTIEQKRKTIITDGTIIPYYIVKNISMSKEILGKKCIHTFDSDSDTSDSTGSRPKYIKKINNK